MSNIHSLLTALESLDGDFNREKLRGFPGQLRSVVKRPIDDRLANDLEQDLLNGIDLKLRLATIKRLARWCKTGGIYSDGMEIALKISLLLFGQVLD
jgi:hypothetical protein